MTWRYALSAGRPPLTENQRLHWAAKASKVRAVRSEAKVRILSAATASERGAWPLTRVRVQLTWNVTDRRRRDAENIVPTLKAICDGLVDAGLVKDDTPAFMHKPMPEIVLRSRDDLSWAPLEVTVTDISQEEP